MFGSIKLFKPSSVLIHSQPASAKLFYIRKFATYSHIVRITPQQLVWDINTGIKFKILDVRTSEEFQKSRIVGSLNTPLSNLAERSKTIDKSNRIFIHCDKNSHFEPEVETDTTSSLKAAVLLKNLGFKQVEVVQGSIEELKQAGFFYHEVEVPQAPEQNNTTQAPPPK